MGVDTIKIKVNNIECTVRKGTTILNAAKCSHIKIPSLCYHPDTNPSAGCGLCVVKVKGNNKLMRACVTEALDGMEITTNDSELYEIRKTILDLILSNHPQDCLQCVRNQNCELQKLAADFGIRNAEFKNINEVLPIDESTASLVLDPQKCILCGRCVDVCQNKQNVNALEFIGRGYSMRIAPAGDIKLNDSPCIKCGQCSAHCPVGAIVERGNLTDVWHAIQDPSKHVVVQMAPAVRVAFGEAFGYESGDVVTKKMYTMFRMLGFHAVFDTNFAADLTIMEEGTELVNKLLNKPESLPLITSCCPSWVDYLEKYYGDMIDHFSTAHSPQEMLGTLIKTYYAQVKNIDPKNIVSVSVMPCTAKKYEITRSKEMESSGYKNVDIVITTRELVRMCKSAGIDFPNLPDSEADSILGNYTGAGVLFGATGGVMEAALRTAYNLVTGKDLEKVDFESVRGLEGIKESSIDIGGTKINVAVAHGTKNVQFLMDKIIDAKKNGKPTPYHFVEVMACEGGCISGGGQPYGVTNEIRKKRTIGIYKDDLNQKFRCSHQNPEIIAVYEKFLGKPGSHKAHELLHTSYKALPLYRK